MAGNVKQFYTTERAAKFLGISIHSVRTYVARGTLVPDERIGTAMLFSRKTLLTYQRNHRRKSAEEQEEP